jgi:hypothetical protein
MRKAAQLELISHTTCVEVVFGKNEESKKHLSAIIRRVCTVEKFSYELVIDKMTSELNSIALPEEKNFFEFVAFSCTRSGS